MEAFCGHDRTAVAGRVASPPLENYTEGSFILLHSEHTQVYLESDAGFFLSADKERAR